MNWEIRWSYGLDIQDSVEYETFQSAFEDFDNLVKKVLKLLADAGYEYDLQWIQISRLNL